MSQPTVSKNPSPEQIAAILRDPEGGGAVALLEDGNGDWWVWRRKASPEHFFMSVELEEDHGASFPPGEGLNRWSAKSVDEAMRIMRERGVYGPCRSPE